MGGSMEDAFLGKKDELQKKGLLKKQAERSQKGRSIDAKKRKEDEPRGDKKERQHQGTQEDYQARKVLPLYADIRKLKADDSDFFMVTHRDFLSTAHTGLLFDKFCDHWSGTEKNWKPEKPPKGPAVKQQFLDQIVKQLNSNEKTDELLTQYHARRDLLLTALKGKSYPFTTSWRFVSGLGMGHVLETGFVWHRILGVPYLPGSSVKGMIRAWAEQWGSEQDKKNAVRLFGPKGEDARKNPDTGALIVFDAIPETKPKLELDIMNPHYGDYYSKKKMKIKLANGKEQEIDTPPADYLSPNPIFFLTVAADVSFKFALAPRPGIGNSTDLSNGYKLLKEALENIGAGAKTAVGYGYFNKVIV